VRGEVAEHSLLPYPHRPRTRLDLQGHVAWPRRLLQPGQRRRGHHQTGKSASRYVWEQQEYHTKLCSCLSVMFSLDTVGDLAATVSDHVGLDWGIPPSDTDTRALVNEFLRWLAPAIAAMVLGVLLAVLVPVVGCCTLCCRACGRCGAKSRIYRKKNQNVKCLILTSIFLVTTSMIFVGATIGAVSAKHVTESLGELESTVNTALTDVGNYLDGGAQQVFFVADDQFGVFEAHVLNDINHIGEWFESSIGSDFQSKALTVINQASSLLSKLREIDAVVVSGNTLVGELRSTTQALISQISTLRGDMETLRVACLADGLGGVCDSLSSTHFAVTVNFTNVRLLLRGRQMCPHHWCYTD
jgi:hypothetical protein